MQIRLSRTDTHIRRVTSLLFACLYYVQTSMGYIHHVRGRMEGSSLSLSVLTKTHTHTRRQISCHGALQWISVLTRVIAFLLGRLWVLIRLDKVCSPARVIFICTPDCAASAGTASAPRPHLSPGRRGGQHPLKIKWLYQLLWEKKSQSCRYWDKFPSPIVGEIRSLVNLF